MKLLFLLLSSFFLFGCGQKKPATIIPENQEETEEMADYSDKFYGEKIEILETKDLNQEFVVKFKTYEPDGVGEAQFKAKKIKEIPDADGSLPEEGKKLVLVEIAVRGLNTNKGLPSTFNQIGDHPSPQFVIMDKNNNKNYVETTYFSDSYTLKNKMYELSKITLDSQDWVNTALVFEIDKKLSPDLGFRFTSTDGKISFYDIKD